MIGEAKYCSNSASILLGTMKTGMTLDQCEQACSTRGLCERFAYGRDPHGNSKKCQLLKEGCSVYG